MLLTWIINSYPDIVLTIIPKTVHMENVCRKYFLRKFNYCREIFLTLIILKSS